MQNLLEWSERNNKKLFYSKEHKLLYIEDGVYNKTENQIKKIGGFRLLKTKDQKNDFIYGYKSNIITDYSYECIMFIKEEVFKTLNPKLNRFSNEIDNVDFINKINLMNDIFNIDGINNEIKEIQQKLDTKNVEENEKTKKALDRIIDSVFSIYYDIKIGFLNSMVMNALNGNFNELDKITEKEIKLRIKKELILEGIDNYTLLNIIINNAYEFNKRKEFKEMLQNMQRAIVLNKKLSIQEEFKDKRYKQKI